MAFVVAVTTTKKIENYTTPGDVTASRSVKCEVDDLVGQCDRPSPGSNLVEGFPAA